MFSKFSSALLAILLFLGAATGHGQVSTATITGVVQDSSGGVIPGATVVLTQTQTNASAQAVSNERGAISVPALAVGPYPMSLASEEREVFIYWLYLALAGPLGQGEVASC